ncbi:MAG: SH3 domain-containing protein [Bacteroidetes bacterium]|nr:SH3 domain-containing protein [Bacteroidota bacterium]MBU1718583.1 SH3 domain-containing protein [Bacteroidota bacterium]
MKKFLFLSGFAVSILLFSACGPSSDENSDQVNTDTVAVQVEEIQPEALAIKGSHVNIRENANTTSKVIMQLNTGDSCKILDKGKKEKIGDQTDFWYHIDYSGNEGWVFGAFTSVKYTGEGKISFISGNGKKIPFYNEVKLIRHFCDPLEDSSDIQSETGKAQGDLAKLKTMVGRLKPENCKTEFTKEAIMSKILEYNIRIKTLDDIKIQPIAVIDYGDNIAEVYQIFLKYTMDSKNLGEFWSDCCQIPADTKEGKLLNLECTVNWVSLRDRDGESWINPASFTQANCKCDCNTMELDYIGDVDNDGQHEIVFKHGYYEGGGLFYLDYRNGMFIMVEVGICGA